MTLSTRRGLELGARPENPLLHLWAMLVAGRGRSGIISLADQAVVSGTSFLTGVLVGRASTKEEFGLFTLGLGIVVFAIGLQTSIISSPFTVYSPRLRGEEQALYIGSTLVHQLGLSIAALAALAAAGFVLSLGVGPPGLAPLVLVLALVMGLITFREFVRRICFARIRMKAALAMDGCVALLQVGGLLTLARLGEITSIRAYWLIGLSSGAVALVWLLAMRGEIRVQASAAWSDLKRNWHQGRWLLAGTLLFTAGMGVYPWLLASLHGTAATGVLGAAMGVAFLANPFFFGLRNFLDPRTAHGYARGGKSEVKSVVTLATLLSLAVMGLFFAMLCFFGGQLVTLLYGDQYAGCDQVVRIVALASLISVMGMPAYSGLLAMERSDVAFKSYLAALAIMLLFGFWLVRDFGVTGAALGFLASNVGSSAVRWFAFCRGVR